MSLMFLFLIKYNKYNVKKSGINMNKRKIRKMRSKFFILLKFLPGRLGDNKYFIIMYKNKDTESLSATNSEDNHAALPSCKNPNKD